MTKKITAAEELAAQLALSAYALYRNKMDHRNSADIDSFYDDIDIIAKNAKVLLRTLVEAKWND